MVCLRRQVDGAIQSEELAGVEVHHEGAKVGARGLAGHFLEKTCLVLRTSDLLAAILRLCA
jgi:hypothetical protein